MKDQRNLSTESRTDAQRTAPRPYAPPRASFVPLELEERLLQACGKLNASVAGCRPLDGQGGPKVS